MATKSATWPWRPGEAGLGTEVAQITLMLLSKSPCVASGRSSERTEGARMGARGAGASRRAPSEAAPTDAAPKVDGSWTKNTAGLS